MSNQEDLFLIKEELSNFELVKLKFQSESVDEICSTSSESQSQDKKEQEIQQYFHHSRVLSKRKVEEEEDGFRTPTSLEHKIAEATQCPPAPRKTKPSLKRKPSFNHHNTNPPLPLLDLSKEIDELLFPIQHSPLSIDPPFLRAKKVRRHQPK